MTSIKRKGTKDGEDNEVNQVDRSIVFSSIWDINSPPPASSKKALVPRVLQKTKRRKLSMEVHKVKMERTEKSEGVQNVFYYEECVVR